MSIRRAYTIAYSYAAAAYSNDLDMFARCLQIHFFSSKKLQKYASRTFTVFFLPTAEEIFFQYVGIITNVRSCICRMRFGK